MSMEINLGQTNLGEPIRWGGIPNFHMLSTGQSGEGKSVKLKEMISQVTEQGGCCVVFDCTGDFCKLGEYNPRNWPVFDATTIDVMHGGISLTPFLPQSQDETPFEISNRIIDTISGSVGLGDAQWAYLSNVVEDGLRRRIISSFSDLVEILKNDESNKDIAKRVLPKIMRIARMISHEDYPYVWGIEPGKLIILDFHKIQDLKHQSLMVELILNEICGPRMNDIPEKSVPLILVFDECQRLRFREGSLIERIIREGRKYGIGAWLSTQCISNIKNAEVFSRVGLRIFFYPGKENVNKTAGILSDGNRSSVELYKRLLNNLRIGQFICTDGHNTMVSEAPII